MMSNHDVVDLVESDDDENTHDVANDVATSELDRKPAARRKQSTTTSSLVLEDDNVLANDTIVESFRQSRQHDPLLLFQDEEYPPLPSSIQGQHAKTQPNCRCRGPQKAKLMYKSNGRPFYGCANNVCQFFSWAFTAENMHWYRFGQHSGHVLVAASGFSASDLLQGRVGDCWFLSALAVVAERPDLISRLFPETQLDTNGLVRVNLFLDGYWKTVVVDNFLPCIIDSTSERQVQQAIQASTRGDSSTVASENSSSKYDPFALADACRDTLRNTQEFLEQHQQNTMGRIDHFFYTKPVQRTVTCQDLAYSTAKKNQLWVSLLEKAYAKSHGSYSAISGGHIAEAFLDLTGAPTLVFELHSREFEPRSFWHQLLHYRQQRLPMGCGTDSSAAGIIGMHAYSILDVREVKNVAFRFFQETGVAHGNVSGFTDYDGTVRLLQIRNPHGKGEWKGAFSDQSYIWEKLLYHQEGDNQEFLTRSMKNDGTFWIDYDNFLMGFSNVDVVLAFLGNHAKSFPSNFPAKLSNHRCARAFEVSLIDEQPDMPFNDTVELYIMGIQKTRRGASKGRADRKKSYKVCDLGILVGEGDENDFISVKGEMFGLGRNGHYRLVLDRKQTRRLVVMPISLGHPAATDKELPFVLRFVSDAPLLIQELPRVPRMDVVMQKFCLESPSSKKQGIRKVLLEDSWYRLVQVECLGTVFLYLCIHEKKLKAQEDHSGLSVAVEANCRGMSCRTETGLLKHETVAKDKQFEAAWRRYSIEFIDECKSRLLLVLFQSGQDTEFGSINCKAIPTPRTLGNSSPSKQTTLQRFLGTETNKASDTAEYRTRGIFNSLSGKGAFDLCTGLSDKVAMTENAAGLQQDVDFELERALAISRGELELQLTCRQDPNQQADAELQRAIELSKKETSFHAESAYDDELAKAIQLSMQGNQSSTRPVAMVDLTEKEEPAKRNREDMENNDTIDPAMKRRMAADAAMSRLNNH